MRYFLIKTKDGRVIKVRTSDPRNAAYTAEKIKAEGIGDIRPQDIVSVDTFDSINSQTNESTSNKP